MGKGVEDHGNDQIGRIFKLSFFVQPSAEPKCAQGSVCCQQEQWWQGRLCGRHLDSGPANQSVPPVDRREGWALLPVDGWWNHPVCFKKKQQEGRGGQHLYRLLFHLAVRRRSTEKDDGAGGSICHQKAGQGQIFGLCRLWQSSPGKLYGDGPCSTRQGAGRSQEGKGLWGVYRAALLAQRRRHHR